MKAMASIIVQIMLLTTFCVLSLSEYSENYESLEIMRQKMKQMEKVIKAQRRRMEQISVVKTAIQQCAKQNKKLKAILKKYKKEYDKLAKTKNNECSRKSDDTHAEKKIVKRGCDEGWSQFRDQCYRTITSKQYTYAEAVAKCATFGATIAAPTDRASDDFITHVWSIGNDLVSFWLGVKKSRDIWAYKNGTEVKYTNWLEDYPRKNGKCVAVFVWKRDRLAKWYDANCSLEENAMVCQKAVK